MQPQTIFQNTSDVFGLYLHSNFEMMFGTIESVWEGPSYQEFNQSQSAFRRYVTESLSCTHYVYPIDLPNCYIVTLLKVVGFKEGFDYLVSCF